QVKARDEAIVGLERHIRGLGITPEERFVVEVERAWEQATTAADRERYRWRRPTIGPEFLESLNRVEGIARSRVVGVCAQVVSGRAAEIPGLELHPLRESDAGDA